MDNFIQLPINLQKACQENEQLNKLLLLRVMVLGNKDWNRIILWDK